MDVRRVWRSSPGWMLAGYSLVLLLLLVYIRILGVVLGADSPLGAEPVAMLISAGLALLVWRRSRRAWRVLVALTAWMSFGLLFHSDLTTYNFPLFLACGAHVAILLSPAVRTHVARPVVPAPSRAPDGG
ncbi:hypothetical protein [Actinopolymorpha singaporensis]|uniref:Uncharacterized protein n=1 Tax=Actinopolymorpha singaporensis TaxID=117157 RepID=A0A1H1Q853_9ACTN|nr:hypothetical protein [Actinopolymorpha singaporensis]SDS19457.1 hypothetical protein SAMN04489717_1915 [Actinopolymorpha singaporensis]